MIIKLLEERSLPNVGLEVSLEDALDELGKESVVVARVEAGQVDGELGSARVELVQPLQVLVGPGAVGQTANDVLLQLAVENVEDELAHHLLAVLKHFLDDGRVALAQRHYVQEQITAGERTLHDPFQPIRLMVWTTYMVL